MFQTSIEIEEFPNDRAIVIKPGAPCVDIEVAGQFRDTLLRLIEQGHRRLVIDMSEVNFLDGSGLGALVSALKALKSQEHGDIRLANLQRPVVSLLEIVRLQRVFSSYPSVDLAVKSFS